MRLLSVVLLIVVLSVAVVTPAFAHEGDCAHDMTTIVSLHDCVMHAVHMGHINNQGVANALMSKLDAAQAARDRGQPAVAANILQAFIHQVEAQSGQHIDPDHATHLIDHARMVVAAL